MTINDLFALANKFRAEGNVQMAFNLWSEMLKMDPFYGPAHINMADTFRQQGNVPAERQHLNLFLDCPVTGRTIQLVPQAQTRIAEIDKQLNPQVQNTQVQK